VLLGSTVMLFILSMRGTAESMRINTEATELRGSGKEG
jgi:hypothetical protein